MRGLLSTRDIRTTNTPLGLLGVALPPVNRAPMPAAAPAPSATPRRERVSPWRVLDRVLGGQTISEGLDAERARLEAEAMRPQQMEQMARLRAMAEQMGPAALIAFETNPEKFGENLAEQYAPQVIASGGVQSVIGSGQRVSAPRDTAFGTSLIRTDPLSPTPQVLMERGPTPSEQAALINATNPVNIAPGGRAIDPRTGETIAEGAPRVFSAGEGAQLYDEQGRRIAENAPPPRAPSAQEVEIEGQLSALTTDVEPVLRDMRSLLESGDIISGFGAEARLQAARALASAGNEQAQRQVAATERYRNLSGRLRVGMAKSLGANPSNADILLLERVTAGDISQSREGLLATLQDGEALAQRQRQALASRRPARQEADGAQGGVVSVTSPQEAAALPRGTRYRAPNGRVYIRE